MSQLIAVTHSGGFHADDVFSAALLDLVFGMGQGIRLVRSRKQDVIEQADIVFDVGGVYDPARLRFDHHQRGYGEKRRNGVPYSSFGLLWRKYGVEACTAALVGKAAGDTATRVAEAVDIELVQGIDAIDCGAQAFLSRGGSVHVVSLSAMIGGFNPGWQETKRDFDGAFFTAMAVARQVLLNTIKSCYDMIAAENRVLQAKTEGSILLLEQNHPWEAGLFKRPDKAALRYVVFPDVSGGWRVQAVPLAPHSFSLHKPLPEIWRGLEAADFDAVTGIAGGIFCHASGFIAGHVSREGALALARLAEGS